VDANPVDRLIPIAVVEDHQVVVEGVRAWIAEDPAARATVVVVTDSVEALLAGPGRQAEVVVLDLDLGQDRGGLTRDLVTERVSRLCDAGLHVVIFSIYVKPLIVQAAMRAGASAFLDKATDRGLFVDTIVAVAHDLPYVTPSMAGGLLVEARLSRREEEALRYLFQGMDYASIGRRMTKPSGEPISETTVKQYVERARAKFAAIGRPCKSTASLLARCIEEGRITSQEVEDYRSRASS
jgi:two-component system nitrate/nitrite response regulator NarL